MGYVTENLIPGERVVFQTKLHPIIFAEPVVFFAVGLVLLTRDWIITGLIMSGLGLWWALSGWIQRNTSEFAVTDKRLIAKVGLISRRTVEMHLTKIESLAIDQPILGRILGFGTVKCRGMGAGDQEFSRVAKAMLVRRHVYEQAELLAQRERAPR
jgi:uncharacterized membrane protein YdbT with pleckstrin-like domain